MTFKYDRHRGNYEGQTGKCDRHTGNHDRHRGNYEGQVVKTDIQVIMKDG